MHVITSFRRRTAPLALLVAVAFAGCSSDTNMMGENDLGVSGDTGAEDSGAAETVDDTSDVAAGEEVNEDAGNEDANEDAGSDDASEDAAPEDVAADGGGTPDLTVPVSTAAAACGLTGSGTQRFVYTQGRNDLEIDETLEYAFDWACDATERTLTGNGVPNHATPNGQFATQLSVQNVSVSFPIESAHTGENTATRESGYALNSVKFDPATAGTCPDDATSADNCNYAMGQDDWSMVATPGDTSPWRFTFGVDDNDAHVQPSGAYHYHGIPVMLVDALNPDHETSMTLIGWAMDGYPMYAVEGYADPMDASSSVVDVTSSYRTLAEPLPSRPSIEDFPLGHFEQDWQYVAGSGDLDECNGRFGVTPEFPSGVYHYYVTRTYPFVQRCVKGMADVRGGGGPGG